MGKVYVCPQRVKSRPIRKKALMTMSCKNSRLNGLLAFCHNPDLTDPRTEESLV